MPEKAMVNFLSVDKLLASNRVGEAFVDDSQLGYTIPLPLESNTTDRLNQVTIGQTLVRQLKALSQR